MSSDQVWITGVGAICPLGDCFEQISDRLLAGHSGVRRAQSFDVSAHACQIAGEIESIPTPPGFNDREFAERERPEQILLWCATRALQDAGWWKDRGDVRIGVALGMGAEWLIHWEETLLRDQPTNTINEFEQDSLLDRVHRELGLRGPRLTIAAACASANHAIEQGRRWIERGLADVCLAGGIEAGVTRMSLAAFGNLRALSRRNDAPEKASRPFDRGRDGFVMGEGGALLVLESSEQARRRGAKTYATVAGFGARSEAHHMIIPSSDPLPAAHAMRTALRQAGVTPEQVSYVNAHATSTPVGDVGEARTLQVVLGEAVQQVPVSSTKSMTGHLLSGSAAIEAVACLAALDRQAIPPTINLEDPDPDCDLCHVAHEAQERLVQVTVSNSFGFGGSNTCLVLRKAG